MKTADEKEFVVEIYIIKHKEQILGTLIGISIGFLLGHFVLLPTFYKWFSDTYIADTPPLLSWFAILCFSTLFLSIAAFIFCTLRRNNNDRR